MRALFSVVITALIMLSFARSAAAARPVIPPEREDEVQALLLPHRLGDELAPGWTLRTIEIDLATIRVGLVGPAEQAAELTLDHPDYAPPGSRVVKSFAVKVTAQPPGSEPALAELVAALEHDDDGNFWGAHGALAPDGEPESRFSDRMPGWVTDGLLVLVLLAGITLALLVHALRQAPRWIALGLLGVVVLGVVARLTLTQEAALEPWSYTRFMIVARMIYEGPGLAIVHPGPVFMTSVVSTTVLVCSLVAPLTVFLTTRYLLASDRAALICAGLVAVLPLHIRFSYGDVSSMPSFTIAALVFAMIQAAAREPSRRWLFAMLALFAAPMLITFLLRPLNILYAPLLVAMVVIDEGVWVDQPRVARWRIAAIVAAVAALTLGFGVPWLLEDFGREVREGLSVTTLVSAIRVLLSFEYDSLLNPSFTPPGFTVLAIVGMVDLVRRKRWRLLVVLVGWLLGSLATHAYVVPKSPFMQARYHLHLVVPFVCLVACGIEALLVRWQGQRRKRRWQVLLFGYLLASPVIHAGFIRDVGFNDQREWAWVHGLREQVPAECTIVEYGGRGAGARWRRVGAHVVAGMPEQRWRVIEIPMAAEGEPLLSEAVKAVLREPPACAYWYEGLPCFGDRPPGAAIAPECAAVRERVELEEVERLELVSRMYDENLARGLQEGDAITLGLWSVRGPKPERE